LGVSSISETPTCFHQNEKLLTEYQRKVVDDSVLPTLRGHKLTPEDQKQREMILKFMTQGEVLIGDDAERSDVEDFLRSMIEDQLVYFEGSTLKLRSEGRPFLRNACVALDKRLREKKPDTKVFSQSL